MKWWTLTKIPNRPAKTNHLWTIIFSLTHLEPLSLAYGLVLCVQHFHFIDTGKTEKIQNLSIEETSQSGNWWCLRSCCGFRAALALLHPVLVASSMLEVLQGFCFCSSPAVLLPFWETTSNIKMKQELQILLHAVGLKSSNVAELLCSFVLLKSGYLNFVWCETVF